MHRLYEILFWPLIACISMGLLHGYAGLHVLRRGVIFVDLALAQLAALGTVVGMVLITPHVHTPACDPAIVAPAEHSSDELEIALREKITPTQASDTDDDASSGLLQFWPTIFALGGAVLLAFGRVPGDRVPHEAIIGIVYVVAAAATLLILSKAPHGHEQMEQMLTGKLLFVDAHEVLTTAGLYAVLGLLHFVFRRPFIAVSNDSAAAQRSGLPVRLLDCLFYAMFALMVTRSVAVAGVLVVFSFLIIPGACASMLVESFGSRVLGSWLIATIVSVSGIVISAVWDLPTGATMVATFGAALVLSILIGSLVRRHNVSDVAAHYETGVLYESKR
jgi:zinc/manganese transport system permease protein